MDKYEISKIDLIILKDLLANQKVSFTNSKPMYELKILEALKQNTVYKRLQYLEKIGFIEKGLKDGKKNTYYITDLGISELEKI